jgi:uncharacterized protein (DUF1778 family)
VTKTSQLQIRISAADKRALRAAAEQAGLDLSSYVLARALPTSPRSQFEALVEQLAQARDEAEQRLSLAELNDFLASLTALEWEPAVGSSAASVLTPFAANYLAAMVESAAHQKAVPLPEWTTHVPALARPWFASQLRSLRLYLLLESPPIFRRRNLFVDASMGARV